MNGIFIYMNGRRVVYVLLQVRQTIKQMIILINTITVKKRSSGGISSNRRGNGREKQTPLLRMQEGMGVIW